MYAIHPWRIYINYNHAKAQFGKRIAKKKNAVLSTRLNWLCNTRGETICSDNALLQVCRRSPAHSPNLKDSDEVHEFHHSGGCNLYELSFRSIFLISSFRIHSFIILYQSSILLSLFNSSNYTIMGSVIGDFWSGENSGPRAASRVFNALIALLGIIAIAVITNHPDHGIIYYIIV